MNNFYEEYGIERPRCGFDCPTGWENLVRHLIEDLIELGWDKDLHQVKEKFGGLRFYVGETTEQMQDMINMAESRSFEICQKCGSDTGVQQAMGYWIGYYCKEHRNV